MEKRSYIRLKDGTYIRMIDDKPASERDAELLKKIGEMQ